MYIFFGNSNRGSASSETVKEAHRTTPRWLPPYMTCRRFILLFDDLTMLAILHVVYDCDYRHWALMFNHPRYFSRFKHACYSSRFSHAHYS